MKRRGGDQLRQRGEKANRRGEGRRREMARIWETLKRREKERR